ncbi:MAG: hypothetical protein WCT28_01085 [Patescibacteria group bacterium]|jgi:hypothetical protein
MENLISQIPRREAPSRPFVEKPKSREAAEDKIGEPILFLKEHELKRSEKIADRQEAQVIREKILERDILDDLNGVSALTLQRDALNNQLRDLRMRRKNADGVFRRFFKSGRDYLTGLDDDIEEVLRERDVIEAELESKLPIQARSKMRPESDELSREDRIAIARERIGEELSHLVIKTKEARPLSRRDELRLDRERLQQELGSIKFWQFGKAGRKREIADEMREIDREMSSIINVDRGI